ncbi:hypothetical protein [Streptomyces antarcticus]|uniref:hypothetical protein n=1 Tax=Streptomyces antarcticus TaxID=2996458 RepID=UPI0022712846|nr:MULTISPECIES: hypothetical protein [unclassified Streptomyces]MCY0947374.1 hypothetical protein [Streptomyces sp. H34-AA3]MCZ4085546.1 hypothetical protein [Streptomyces sp. H34-S5]
MGIESDHLVYEYLSRVGDLAQRRHLDSGDRMRLVAGLRDEIDRRRAKYDPETPAAVRRILERIGTPEEVLDTLGTLSGTAPAGRAAAPAAFGPGPAVPTQRGPGRPRRKAVPPPRPEAEPENVPPHLAGLDELGPSDGVEPDWWRVAPGAYGAGPQVDGFAGGIEIPDLFKEGPEDEDGDGDKAGTGTGTGTADRPGKPSGPPEARARAVVRLLRERRRAKRAAKEAAPVVAEAAAPARPKTNAFLLLAAAVLVAGVVSGYWLLLVVGWLLPYASRALRPGEHKWAVFGPPGAVLAGAAVWLWGRMNGKWGETLAEEQLSEVLHGMGPWLLRAAGVASALYLVWRARRR